MSHQHIGSAFIFLKTKKKSLKPIEWIGCISRWAVAIFNIVRNTVVQVGAPPDLQITFNLKNIIQNV